MPYRLDEAAYALCRPTSIAPSDACGRTRIARTSSATWSARSGTGSQGCPVWPTASSSRPRWTRSSTTSAQSTPGPSRLQPRGRAAPQAKLQRIRKGQEIAGVCNGIAEYSQIRVDWVRALFVLATLLTGGFLIVYIILAFVLPVADPEPARR